RGFLSRSYGHRSPAGAHTTTRWCGAAPDLPLHRVREGATATPARWEAMRGASMRPWGPREVERLVRQLRQPRIELGNLAQRLRVDGWTDADIEPIALARAQLGQSQALLLGVARRLRGGER